MVFEHPSLFLAENLIKIPTICQNSVLGMLMLQGSNKSVERVYFPDIKPSVVEDDFSFPRPPDPSA